MSENPAPRASTVLLDESFVPVTSSSNDWEDSPNWYDAYTPGSADGYYVNGDTGVLRTNDVGDYEGRAIMGANVGPVADFAWLVRFRFPGSREVLPSIPYRASSTKMYGDQRYQLVIERGGTVTIDGIGFTDPAVSTKLPSFTTSAWYWIELQVVGNKHTVRVWRDGTDKPTDWQLTKTSGGRLSGYTGLAALGGAATQPAYLEFNRATLRTVDAAPPTPPTVDLGVPANSATVGVAFSRTATVTGTSLTRAWQLERPPTSAAALTITGGGATAAFTPDVPGDYRVTLTVTDSAGQAARDSFSLTAATVGDTKGGRAVYLDGAWRLARHRVAQGGAWTP